MFTIEFDQLGHGFRCIAERWDDVFAANVSCNSLRATVRQLNPRETRELHFALSRSNEAFADDPVWESPALQRLLKMQNAAKEAARRHPSGQIAQENGCSCRLIPAFSD